MSNVFNDPFAIRIAIIGRCSVGKSTVINAIARHKVCDVKSMKSTALFNFFEFTKESGIPKSFSDELEGLNSKVRAEGKVGQENNKIYKVPVKNNIVTMGSQFKLVLVDTPGLDETNESLQPMYQLIGHKFAFFDLGLVVLDKHDLLDLDCDSSELIKMLKLIRDKHPQVPFVLLLNKIDEYASDEELDGMIKLLCHKIRDEFYPEGSKEPEEILGDMAAAASSLPNTPYEGLVLPVVLPVSARNAYLFGATSRYVPEINNNEVGCDDDEEKQTALETAAQRLRSTNKELFDEFGRIEHGNSFRRVNERDQIKLVASRIQNCPGQFKENFDKVFDVIECAIGGGKRQRAICNYHLESQTDNWVLAPHNMESELRPIYNARISLELETGSLKGMFQQKLQVKREKAIDKFKMKAQLVGISEIMDLLLGYLKFVLRCGDDREWGVAECENVIQQMEKLVKLQLDTTLQNATAFYTGNPFFLKWSKLNYEDFNNIFTAIEAATKESKWNAFDYFKEYMSRIGKLRYHEMKFIDKMEEDKKCDHEENAKTILSQQLIDHPSHWGHLLFVFSEAKHLVLSCGVVKKNIKEQAVEEQNRKNSYENIGSPERDGCCGNKNNCQGDNRKERSTEKSSTPSEGGSAKSRQSKIQMQQGNINADSSDGKNNINGNDNDSKNNGNEQASNKRDNDNGDTSKQPHFDSIDLCED